MGVGSPDALILFSIYCTRVRVQWVHNACAHAPNACGIASSGVSEVTALHGQPRSKCLQRSLLCHGVHLSWCLSKSCPHKRLCVTCTPTAAQADLTDGDQEVFRPRQCDGVHAVLLQMSLRTRDCVAGRWSTWVIATGPDGVSCANDRWTML